MAKLDRDTLADGFFGVGRVLSIYGTSLIESNDENDAEPQGLRSRVPSELVTCIAEDYSLEDRERLAMVAANAALSAVSEQYQGGPIGRNIAQAAARMALGLEQLPEQQGGDN